MRWCWPARPRPSSRSTSRSPWWCCWSSWRSPISRPVHAYPNGGGSYVVSRENLGLLPGSWWPPGSLMVDYVMTVAVSVASGVAAIRDRLPVAGRAIPRRIRTGIVFSSASVSSSLSPSPTCGGCASRAVSSPSPPMPSSCCAAVSSWSWDSSAGSREIFDAAPAVAGGTTLQGVALLWIVLAGLLGRLLGHDRYRSHLQRRAGLQAAREQERRHSLWASWRAFWPFCCWGSPLLARY